MATTWQDSYEEDEYEEIDAPGCYGYFDNDDMSCRVCPARQQCIEEYEASLPPCFGRLHNVSAGECAACIDESACANLQFEKENSKMARGKVRVRRPRRPRPEPEPDMEEEEDEEVEDEEVEEAPQSQPKSRRRVVRRAEPEPEDEEEEPEDEGDDYGDWSVPELREELEARGLDASGRKSALIGRLMADDDGEDVPEPAPAPRRARPVTKTKPKVVEDEPVTVASLDEIFEQMEQGSIISVTKTKSGYQLTVGGSAATAKPVGRGLRGQEFEKEAWTGEYYSWYREDAGSGKPWADMESEEKYAMAEELEVEWESHEDGRVDNLRMVQALLTKLGIEKYKPQYASTAARKALR